ncbi:MAG: hypothetical protein ACTH6N_11165 [Brachybacterium tyrofermentans]
MRSSRSTSPLSRACRSILLALPAPSDLLALPDRLTQLDRLALLDRLTLPDRLMLSALPRRSTTKAAPAPVCWDAP